jgi:tetratricopeptide (TPR) repeat protein
MRRVSLMLCAALLGSSSLAEAQDASFSRAIELRNQKTPRWREVANLMTAAIQANANESDRKVGRTLFLGGTEYLPFFFLGEAHYNLGDCAAAVTAWARSEQQGVVKGNAELYAILRAGNAACEAKGVLLPGKYEIALSNTQKLYEDVHAMSQRVWARGQANLPLWRAEMNESFDRSSAELSDSYDRLTSGTKSRLLVDFNASRAAADRARGLLTALESTLTAAIEQNRTITTQAQEIEQILAGAESHNRAIDSRKSSWGPSHASGIQAGRDTLGKAQDRLNTALRASNPALLPEARNLALDASGRLKSVLDDLVRIERIAFDRQFTELQVSAQDVFTLLQSDLSSLTQLSGERPEAGAAVGQERQAIETQVGMARRRFETARKGENLDGIRAAITMAFEARARLAGLIAQFGPLDLTRRGVHPALQEGARLYFQGQYQQALTALEQADAFGPEVPLQVHVHLIRAAALYALFVRSGEADQSLRSRALEETARARAINPEVVPDGRYSPSFVAFFQNGAAAPLQRASRP